MRLALVFGVLFVCGSALTTPGDMAVTALELYWSTIIGALVFTLIAIRIHRGTETFPRDMLAFGVVVLAVSLVAGYLHFAPGQWIVPGDAWSKLGPKHELQVSVTAVGEELAFVGRWALYSWSTVWHHALLIMAWFFLAFATTEIVKDIRRRQGG